MAQNPVRWFEIYVQDMDRAKRFYAGVFQIELARLDSPGAERWAFPMQMDQMGTAGALVQMDGVPSGGNSTIVYFACADCAVEEGLASKHGGRIRQGKTAIGEYGFISLGCDTEGNLIGLHSME